MLDNEAMKNVDRSVSLGNCISGGGGGVWNEIESRVSKARVVFSNLGHLWRQTVISLRVVLLYGSETWPLRVEDVNCLQVFDHRCLCSIARIGWHQRVINEEIRNFILFILRPFLPHLQQKQRNNLNSPF
ncbi:hypothetical protein EG68_00729 [Paragonimus skrjabini miyazakii]|uniref:Uncharacterized protein n=1 Tax=Paragonimus skrjabini miyazakii TaxID=59628 RepID=A0A8S9Z386_9TREM|nr:hypothetical protein EG68_00729 [Paragonimus skrjabini miyazakii]